MNTKCIYWITKHFGNKAGDLKFANELGNEGFELVAVVQYGTKSGYFFKREIV